RLDLHPGRERAPPGLHGRARLPLDRGRAIRPRAAGAAPQVCPTPALPAPLGPALSRDGGPDRDNAAGRLRLRRRLDAELTRPGITRGVPAGFGGQAASANARAATPTT